MEMNEDENANFKGLVSEISASERRILLEKMRGEAGDDDSLSEDDFSGIELGDDSHITLSEKLKQESLLKRFLMWLLAALTNSTVEKVYNKFLVSAIAKNLERESPGLIEYRRNQLYTIFYEKLSQLVTVQKFFAPYIDCYENAPASFYIQLANIMNPELGEQIRKEADPYVYPLDKEVTKESKNSLVRKMNAILDSLPPLQKREMYAAVKGVEWLRSFDHLPIARFVQRFESSEEGRVCQFVSARNDFEPLANVLFSAYPVDEALLSALYQFAEQMLGADEKAANGIQPGMNDFMDMAGNQISVLNMFVSTVPVTKLSKIIFADAMYMPVSPGGGEDWFSKFKNQWRVMFDQRWEQWIRDCAKEKVKKLLSGYFALSNFPVFPFRPWHRLWGGLSFRHELTLGFINFFMKEKFADVFATLKIVSLEGEFSIKENRMELTDTLNEFVSLRENLDILSNRLGAGGEYGLEFSRYEGAGRSVSSVERIKKLMDEIERFVSEMISSAGKCFRVTESLLNGMLSDRISSYYGPLVNMSKIRGHENKKFMADLQYTKDTIEHAFEVLKEIEPLDAPVLQGR